MAEQSVDPTKVQLGKPVSFIGVTFSSIGVRFLTEAEMTQRQSITKPTRAQRTLEHTTRAAGSSTGWRAPFAGALVVPTLF